MSRPLYIRTHTLLLQQVGPSLRPIKFLSFFGMHGTEFKIIDAITGSNVDLAKERIVSRIMRLLDLAVESLGSGPSEDGGEDEPISATTKESLEEVYSKKCGQDIVPSELPSSVILGKMHRSVVSGTFSLIKVTSIVLQSAFSLSARDAELVMTSSGGLENCIS